MHPCMTGSFFAHACHQNHDRVDLRSNRRHLTRLSSTPTFVHFFSNVYPNVYRIRIIRIRIQFGSGSSEANSEFFGSGLSGSIRLATTHCVWVRVCVSVWQVAHIHARALSPSSPWVDAKNSIWRRMGFRQKSHLCRKSWFEWVLQWKAMTPLH